MNQQQEITWVPSYAASEQLVRSNSLISAQLPPIQSSISSHSVHPEFNSVMSSQFSPMCNQSPQFPPMSHQSSQLAPLCHPTPQYSPMCWSSPQFPPLCHQSPQLAPMCHSSDQNMSSTSGSKVAGSMRQVWPAAHHPPNSPVPEIRADNMTIWQTAEWVRTLGRYHAWKEADAYADNFKANNICGYLLKKIDERDTKEGIGHYQARSPSEDNVSDKTYVSTDGFSGEKTFA